MVFTRMSSQHDRYPGLSLIAASILFIAPLASLAPGCVDDETLGEAPPVSATGAPLLVAASNAWPIGPIEVCWNPISTQTDPAKREVVRRALEESWSAVTQVTFTGWGNCSSTGDPSNRISVHTRPGRSAASIGKSGSNWIGLDLDTPPLRATTIHEFGHSLGFYHEQADPRTPAWCTDNDGDLRANPPGSIPAGYWDATSIMNYCNPHWSNGALSRMDIIGARKYYGARYGIAGIDSAFADVTGDNKADALVVNPDGVYMLTSNGSTFTGYRRVTDGPFYGGMGTFFADVSGDGKADAIAVNADGIAVMTSNGTSFTNYTQWSGAFWGGRGTYFADVTGDGKADAIAINDDRVYVMPSTGTSFTGFRALTSGPFYGRRGTHFADVTGDGKADGVVVNDGGISVLTSDGTNLVNYADWSGPFYGSRATVIADVTGDGKADAVAVNDDNTYLISSTGSSFVWYHAAGYGPFYGNRGTYFADFTGEGRADGIAVTDWQLWGQVSAGWYFNAVSAVTSGPFYPLF